MNDFLYRGQADTVPRKLFRRMKALENAEQLVRIVRVEADTIIPNGKHILIPCPLAGNGYFGPWSRAGKLKSVGQDIGSYLPE